MEKHFKETNLNYLFKQYYTSILSNNLNKKELEDFFNIQLNKLPITLRVNKLNSFCDFVESELQSLLDEEEVTYKRHRINLPLDNVYEFQIQKKNQKLKNFLINENDMGISRQELVAMIPVYLLNIDDDYIILDMCASPGNKSLQILELMNEKARLKNITARGVLVANELDIGRANKLVHLIHSQPAPNVIVTQYAAENFPLSDKIKYNIIFCDVPCSGDGTLRKNKGLRKRWKPFYALRNHSIQFNILENAIRLANDYIVYSTCSNDPIENEAVIAYILEKYSGYIEIIDVSEKLKSLNINFNEGLIKWKIAYDWDKENIFWAYDYSQVKKNKDIIKESMFHDIYTKKNHQNNLYFKDPLDLKKCIRLYSHQNNSGSFFIAVLKKVKSIEDNKFTKTEININEIKKSIADDLDEFMGFLIFKDENNIINENRENEDEEEIIFTQFVNFSKYTESYNNLNDFFKIDQKVTDYLQTFYKSSTKVFLFSDKMKEVIKVFANLNVNVINSGLLVFLKDRKPIDCKYRITYFGALLLSYAINGQKIILKEENVDFLLKIMNFKKIKFNELNEIEYKLIEPYRKGSLIINYDEINILVRKGKNSICVMIPEIYLNNIIYYIKKYIK